MNHSVLTEALEQPGSKTHVHVHNIVNYATQISDKQKKISYDVASGSERTPCIKFDKPLVVYRFSGNVMTSLSTLCT